MRNLNLPNLVTLLRIALVPVVVCAILARDFGLALAAALAAGATDGLDGLLARLLHAQTRVGAYLDPIADKLLLSATYIALGAAGAVPWWLVFLIFGRDIVILMMAGAALLFTDYRDFPPSIWGKISTFFQIVAALAVLAAGAFPDWNLFVSPLLWTTAGTTTLSGTLYVWRAIGMAKRRVSAAQKHVN